MKKAVLFRRERTIHREIVTFQAEESYGAHVFKIRMSMLDHEQLNSNALPPTLPWHALFQLESPCYDDPSALICRHCILFILTLIP